MRTGPRVAQVVRAETLDSRAFERATPTLIVTTRDRLFLQRKYPLPVFPELLVQHVHRAGVKRHSKTFAGFRLVTMHPGNGALQIDV